jgi:hypothetical protein
MDRVLEVVVVGIFLGGWIQSADSAYEPRIGITHDLWGI